MTNTARDCDGVKALGFAGQDYGFRSFKSDVRRRARGGRYGAYQPGEGRMRPASAKLSCQLNRRVLEHIGICHQSALREAGV